MKEMKKIAEGKNFTACDFGKLNDLGGYVLQLGDIKIPGKAHDDLIVIANDFSSFLYFSHIVSLPDQICCKSVP